MVAYLCNYLSVYFQGVDPGYEIKLGGGGSLDKIVSNCVK